MDTTQEKNSVSAAPTRIQRQRTKGWKAPYNTVNVTRPSEWGNPHKVLVKGTEQIAVNLFEQDLLDGTLLDCRGKPLINRIGELRGRNIMCWCKVGDPCHGTVLLRLANSDSAIAEDGGVSNVHQANN